MREIFVSYRREDASDSAGRLCRELGEQFGSGAVFRDVVTLEPGCDFAQTIQATIPRAKVVLVVIGKQWLRVLRRRVDDPGDLLVTEIATALNDRDRLLVIPVLVQRAAMPKLSQLPEPLQPLCTLNAVELDDEPRWDFDMRRLVAAIEPKVPRLPSAPDLAQTAVAQAPTVPIDRPTASPPEPESKDRRARGVRPVAAVAAAVAAASVIGGLVVLPSEGGTPKRQAVLAGAASSLPDQTSTVPPTSEPVPTTVGSTGRNAASQPRVGASGGAAPSDPGTGQAPGPAPTSPAVTSPPAPPPTATATTVATTIPRAGDEQPPVGKLTIAPPSGRQGTVILLSAGACARPAGWTGGETYYGLNDPRAGTDPAGGRRWWTGPEPWQGQLTVPSLAPGEYWVWANCFAMNPITNQWEMFYLYPSVAFYVT